MRTGQPESLAYLEGGRIAAQLLQKAEHIVVFGSWLEKDMQAKGICHFASFAQHVFQVHLRTVLAV